MPEISDYIAVVTDQPDNLILVHLSRIDEKVDRIEARLGRIERRPDLTPA
jgi:hypothetical protein